MTQPKLFALERPGFKGDNDGPLTEFGQWDLEKRTSGPAPICPVCGGFIGMLTWLSPFEVELESWARDFGDFVYGPGYDILVSERFRLLYEENRLIGLSGFDPVTVKRVIRRRGGTSNPPKYFRAVVAFARSAIDFDASELDGLRSRSEMCVECRDIGVKRWKRVVIEPGTFSGEDIAIPRGLFMYLVTERFKNLCEHYQLRNMCFVPIDEFGHDYYPWEQGQ